MEQRQLEIHWWGPWNLVNEDVGEGDQMKTEVVVMDKDYKERHQQEEHVAVPRSMYIAKGDLEAHGYTARCPGCISILRGTARQAHTEGCRRRLEKEMAGTGKAMRAQKRKAEFKGEEGGTEATRAEEAMAAQRRGWSC